MDPLHMWHDLRVSTHSEHALCPHRNATLLCLSMQMVHRHLSSRSRSLACSCFTVSESELVRCRPSLLSSSFS